MWWGGVRFLIDERHCAGRLGKPTGEKLIAGEEGVWCEGTAARLGGRECERAKGRGVPKERGKRLLLWQLCVYFHSSLAGGSPWLGKGCDVGVGWEGAAGGACHVTWLVCVGKEGQSGEPSHCSCSGCSEGLSVGEVGPRAPAPRQPQSPLRGLQQGP